jgi:hypothetical protein
VWQVIQSGILPELAQPQAAQAVYKRLDSAFSGDGPRSRAWEYMSKANVIPFRCRSAEIAGSIFLGRFVIMIL